MQTTYYTLYAREAVAEDMARASGGGDRLVHFRQVPLPRRAPRREDNVIRLSDYRAPMAAGPARRAQDGPSPAPRPRTDHSRDCLRLLELIACGAIICVAAAAAVALLL